MAIINNHGMSGSLTGAGRVTGLKTSIGSATAQPGLTLKAQPSTNLRRSQASQEFARPGKPGMSGAPGGRPRVTPTDPNMGAGRLTGIPPQVATPTPRPKPIIGAAPQPTPRPKPITGGPMPTPRPKPIIGAAPQPTPRPKPIIGGATAQPGTTLRPQPSVTPRPKPKLY